MAHFTVTDNREPNPRDAVGLAGMIRADIAATQHSIANRPVCQQFREHQTYRLRQLKRNLRWVRASLRQQDNKEVSIER
jgi:hypothetical protein